MDSKESPETDAEEILAKISLHDIDDDESASSRHIYPSNEALSSAQLVQGNIYFFRSLSNDITSVDMVCKSLEVGPAEATITESSEN